VFADLGALSQEPDPVSGPRLLKHNHAWMALTPVRYVFLSVAEKKTRRIGLVWSACRVLVPH
jgi:hypothetical protein